MATINGTSGNDSLAGTSGEDTINGLGGNDTLNGNGGTDFFDGGGGFDTIDFRSIGSGLSIDFTNGTISGGLFGEFSAIERVQAGSGNDSIIGAAGGQNLAGQGGADTLWGATGADTLWGGSGADTFNFREFGTADADRLGDFASGTDKILLDGTAMTALGAGNFTAGDARFAANASGTAQDASDRVIYNTSTRQVFYDADGNGAGARQLIATLQSGATLVATDIELQGESGGTGQELTGTSGADTLAGTQGDDTIRGLGGNDFLLGNEGADFLQGGDGNDTLIGGESTGINNADDLASDTLDGGLGDDVYHVVARQEGGDVIIADAGGVDTVIAWSNWTLGPGLENLTLGDDAGVGASGTGNELDNRIISATEGGTISGLGGNDTLIISGGENTITARGGEGNDTIQGRGSDNDVLSGDAGNDLLSGGGGFSTMTGGAGADVFLFDIIAGFDEELITDFASGADMLRLDATQMPDLGASGRFDADDQRFAANSSGTAQDSSDRVIYNSSTGQLWYDADGSGSGEAGLIFTLQGAPALAAADIEVVNGSGPSGSAINGTSGRDTLSGTSGDDTINGLGGNDLFLAGSTGGADIMDGGAGSDSIEFKNAATSAVVVDYVAGTISGGSAGGTISFTSIERLVAGNFNDSLSGNAAAQNLTGQGGADTLAGAGGVDTLWGGGGNDFFVFREMGSANADRVSDFASGQDELQLDDSAFSAIGAMGNFTAGDGRFWAAAGATSGHDAGDRVVYNTSTGSLYYDADGSGGGAAQLVATITGHPAVAATDIAVI